MLSIISMVTSACSGGAEGSSTDSEGAGIHTEASNGKQSHTTGVIAARGDSSSGRSATFVDQFGSEFTEFKIADTNDKLATPRDLEFHPDPVRDDELWVVNRATDSMTIIHETGTPQQWSENRVDAYANHFMEEVSAIAFGADHHEFDYQFATAQDTRNTYDGQAAPNNFMGPTLWPSSLSHFVVEHQNDQYLGSHIDMNHESPNGMGIAHDSGNAFWYFDGYYGNLVYYDFAIDHDTGMDDHSDAVVRRYSDVTLTRQVNVPSHMVVDKSNGILYIADTGAGRIVWVNTDDPTTSSTNIMNDNSRLEPLAEYSRVTGVEWGVLATGLTRPSGIAIDGDTLLASTNGDGIVTAWALSSDGKGATKLDSIQTTANSIMGIEVGPDNKLYYVDGSGNSVIRIDPTWDGDGDLVDDRSDNCPTVANADQADLDGDLIGDLCDPDIDGDGIYNTTDGCSNGESGWTSDEVTDLDGDGCRDSTEDDDDDGDGWSDLDEQACSTNPLDSNEEPPDTDGDKICNPIDEDDDGDSWSDMDEEQCGSNPLDSISKPSDHDEDGSCDVMDADDDNDGICDTGEKADDCITGGPGYDRCPYSALGFISGLAPDIDSDGCEDATDDDDDDDDGFPDLLDACSKVVGSSDKGGMDGCPDRDGDGWANDIDPLPYDVTQWSDKDRDGFGDNQDGNESDACIDFAGKSKIDRFGCPDSDKDGYSDPDSQWTILDGADAFYDQKTQWRDRDSDRFGDEVGGFEADACPDDFGTSIHDRFGCLDSDKDGWSDLNDAYIDNPDQWSDKDGDGFGDRLFGNLRDDCPDEFGNSKEYLQGCSDRDGDGWPDIYWDIFPDFAHSWSDGDRDGFSDQQGNELSDDCPREAGTSTVDRRGCVDSDGDGVSDVGDVYPQDASKSASVIAIGSPLAMVSVIVIIAILGAIGVLGVLASRRSKSSDLDHMFAAQSPTKSTEIAVAPTTFQQQGPLGPPIPPEGLPPGWTAEQWAHYGHQWADYYRQ